MKSKIHENNKNNKIMSKKSVLILAFAIATLSVVSCNKNEKTEVTTEHEGHNHKEGEAHKVAYECPMDCEKGKTYDKKGSCPVCKMDLIEAKADNHEGTTMQLKIMKDMTIQKKTTTDIIINT